MNLSPMKTFDNLEGWEEFIAIDGSRWLGRVISTVGDVITLHPCVQMVRDPVATIVPMPEMNPLTKQPMLVMKRAVEADGTFFCPFGIDMIPPPRRFNGWSARARLVDFPTKIQEGILAGINNLIRRVDQRSDDAPKSRLVQ